MTEFIGRIGLGDGWTLVLDEPFVDDPVVGEHVLTFSNSQLLVLPTVLPVADDVSDEWVADWNVAASAKAVADGVADRDLGPIAGSGWSGSLADAALEESERKLMAFLAGPRACLHLTVRFMDPAAEPAARALISSVVHNAGGAAEMNRVLRVGGQLLDGRPATE